MQHNDMCTLQSWPYVGTKFHTHKLSFMVDATRCLFWMVMINANSNKNGPFALIQFAICTQHMSVNFTRTYRIGPVTRTDSHHFCVNRIGVCWTISFDFLTKNRPKFKLYLLQMPNQNKSIAKLARTVYLFWMSLSSMQTKKFAIFADYDEMLRLCCRRVFYFSLSIYDTQKTTTKKIMFSWFLSFYLFFLHCRRCRRRWFSLNRKIRSF